MKQNEEKQNKELEKNERPRKNGQYRYTVNNGYMKQNEEKQNKELEKNDPLLTVYLYCPFFPGLSFFSSSLFCFSSFCFMYPLLTVYLYCPFFHKELEKNERPRKNGQYRYTVNNGYMKQNEEKQNKELEKNERPGKNGLSSSLFCFSSFCFMYPLLTVYLYCPFFLGLSFFSSSLFCFSSFCFMYPLLTVYLYCPFFLTKQRTREKQTAKKEWTIQIHS
jgi:hypothetical protein